MSIRLFVSTGITAVAAVAVAAQAASAAPPKTFLCTQIKNGPHASYTMQTNNKRVSGTTWSVFATGVSCSTATKAAPTLLKLWAKAKVDASFSAKGFLCTKERAINGSSGTAGCIYSGLNNIELMMTGSLTVAELKQMFFIG
jgi:hypothetical protein